MPDLQLARGSEKTELRGMAPDDLVRALDAIAMSKGMDRNAYVVIVLESHVRKYLEELSVVRAALRGNALMPEAERSVSP